MTIIPRRVQLIAALAVVAVAGCGLQRQRDFERAAENCRAMWEPKTGNYEARARCWAAAVAAYYPADAMGAVAGKTKIALAMKVDRGEITVEDAEAQMAKLWFDMGHQTAQTKAAEDTANMLLWRR